MWDPERLLGQFLKSSLRSGPDGGSKLLGGMPIGLGALGVAIAAFEHFSQQAKEAQPTETPAVPPPIPPLPSMSGPEYGNPATAAGGVAPPPLPTRGRPSDSVTTPASVPIHHPGQLADDTARQERALWLLRAMIAAAAADGQVDEQERDKILAQAANSGLTAEDREYLLQELNRPRSVFELAAAATSDEMREQMFAVSLLALDVDTALEKDYLATLATALHLTPQQVANIQMQMGD